MSLLFEQSASAQLEEARLAVLERFQGCEQCIRNIESKSVIMHECRCSEVVIENGKARKVRSEDEAITAIDRFPEAAVSRTLRLLIVREVNLFRPRTTQLHQTMEKPRIEKMRRTLDQQASPNMRKKHRASPSHNQVP